MGAVVRAALVAALLAPGAGALEPLDDWLRQIASANHLVDRGDFAQAQALYSGALAEAQMAGDDLRAGLVLQNLGRLLDRKGELREAEKAFRRAVSALKRVPDADPRLLVRTYVGLTAVYIQAGEYTKGEALIRSVAASNLTAAEADRASLMGSLGVILAHKSRFAEAEQVLRETARLCEGSPDAEMQEVGAIAVANLAGVRMHLGRLGEAIESYRQAIAIMEGIPAASPVTLTVTLADSAKALHRGGDHRTAEAQYRRAIALAEARLGGGHVVLADVLRQYAGFVREAGRRSEARQIAETAQRIQDHWRRDNLIGYTVEYDRLLVEK